MKKTKKMLLGAIVAICVCVSVICGATYALFTSESTVNIAVTSGTVSVTATVDKDSVQSKALGETYKDGAGNTYAGEAKVNADGNVEMTNIVPGDALKFDLVVTNHSSVGVKYRVHIDRTGNSELMNALAFTVGGVDYTGLVSYASAWKTWSGEKTLRIPVEIELPEEADNKYGNLSCNIVYTVEAVQGNADRDDAESLVKTKVSTAPELAKALNYACGQGGEVVLTKDIVLEGTNNFAFYADAKIDLGGHTLSLPATSYMWAYEGDVSVTNGTMTVAENNAYVLLASDGHTLAMENVTADIGITTGVPVYIMENGIADFKNVTINGSNALFTSSAGTPKSNPLIYSMSGTELHFDNVTVNDTSNADKTTADITSPMLNFAGKNAVLENCHINAVNRSIATLYTRNSALTVKGGEIYTGYNGAAIMTNAAQAASNIVMNFEDTKIRAPYGTGLICNLDAQLTLQKTVVTAGLHAVVVRGGVATIRDSVLTVNLTDAEHNTYLDKYPGFVDTWSSGNSIPVGVLVVGNKNGTAYPATAECTVIGTELHLNDVPEDVTYAALARIAAIDGDDARSAKLTIGEGCNFVASDVSNDGGNVTIA